MTTEGVDEAGNDESVGFQLLFNQLVINEGVTPTSLAAKGAPLQLVSGEWDGVA